MMKVLSALLIFIGVFLVQRSKLKKAGSTN